MFLTYSTQLRNESDPAIIANLQRKGWIETVQPNHDPATQHAPEWRDGAWVVRDKTTEELAAAARKVWTSVHEFWAEFTDAEMLAIVSSALSGIKLLTEELRMWRGEVWSDDPKVQQGLGGLVATGILTPERQASILSR